MFVKILDGDYILGVAIASTGIEIGEQEYNELTEIFHTMPTPREGYEIKLTAEHEWVEVPIDPDPEIDDSEALSIMLGEETK